MWLHHITLLKWKLQNYRSWLQVKDNPCWQWNQCSKASSSHFSNGHKKILAKNSLLDRKEPKKRWLFPGAAVWRHQCNNSMMHLFLVSRLSVIISCHYWIADQPLRCIPPPAVSEGVDAALVTSARKFVFSPVPIWWLVGWFVSRITQKLVSTQNRPQ